MDALSHYHAAEDLFARANSGGDAPEVDTDGDVRDFLLAGIGHALLALTGVTLLNDSRDGVDFDDYEMWYPIVSVTAPIPPETDDEEDAPADLSLSVGDISPTDPDDLGHWLRGLPFGTILRDTNGDAGQISTGFETVYQAPDREFPALLDIASGRPMELTKGHNDVLGLAENCAPFEVLGLPPADAE